ncbi:MAG: DUF4468 domain-containing protein [Bacteroidetes bacterium]|nr:DUF4468 domain-containing protein [Bacteroidota bacterium]
MKQLFTVILLFMTLCGYCERKSSLPYDSTAKKFIIDTVIEAESKTKDALHSLVIEWIALNYKSANDVIQLNDKENGTIIAKGVYVNVIFAPVLALGYEVGHTLTIKIKDNKIKVTIDNLKYEYFDKGHHSYSLESLLITKPVLAKKQMITFEHNINKRLSATIEEISKYINTTVKNDW